MLATLRQRNFALLWFGGLISITGNAMIFMALPLYVYNTTGSTLATSIMFLMGILPRLFLGSIAGVFVDRWNRQRILLIANILFAIGLLPLLLVSSAESIWLVYLVQFIESIVGVFASPAEDALLPNLVGQEHLAAANSLNSMNNNIASLIGPPLGGLIVGMFGLSGVVLFDIVSFVVAGALILLMRGVPGPAGRPAPIEAASLRQTWASFWREWLDGLNLVRRQQLVAFIFLMTAIVSLGVSIFSTLFFPFASNVLGGSEVEIGWLIAAQSVGGLIGSLLASKLVTRGSLVRTLGLSTMALGVIDLVLFNYAAFYPSIGVALGILLLAGVPGIINVTCVSTLIQMNVAGMYLGRVFAALGTTIALVSVLGTLIAGVLGDALGIVAILNIQGIVFILVGSIVLYQVVSGGLAKMTKTEEVRPAVVEEGAI